jgi:hypothetical protein
VRRRRLCETAPAFYCACPVSTLNRLDTCSWIAAKARLPKSTACLVVTRQTKCVSGWTLSTVGTGSPALILLRPDPIRVSLVDGYTPDYCQPAVCVGLARARRPLRRPSCISPSSQQRLSTCGRPSCGRTALRRTVACCTSVMLSYAFLRLRPRADPA